MLTPSSHSGFPLLPQITSGRFTNASTPQAASDGIISLHPDLPGFGEFRNRKDSMECSHVPIAVLLPILTLLNSVNFFHCVITSLDIVYTNSAK